MAVQVFVQNPESGEPWALCGSLLEDWQLLAKSIGYFAQAEAQNAADNKEKTFSLDFKLVEMTDEEVAALPDI